MFRKDFVLISILVVLSFLIGPVLAIVGANMDPYYRLHITYNGLEHDWLPDDCPPYHIVDEPKGCSLFVPYAVNVSRSICSRTCTQLTAQHINLINSKLENHIKIVVSDNTKSSSVSCHMQWNRYMHLHGFDLRIEYIWIDHLWTKHDILELVQCQAHPIQSLKPLKEGDSFYVSRTMLMKHRVSVGEQIGSIMLFLFGILLLSCCCAGLITFICLSACHACRNRRRKLRNRANLKKKDSSIYPNTFEQGMVDMNDTQPMYIPYYMMNSTNYAVPVPLQPGFVENREERIYQIPDMQGGNVITQ